MESAIRHRGRARVLQKIRQAGIDGDIAEDAVREVFEEVDEGALLDRALERRLRGKTPRDLDDKGRARIVRGLVGAGLFGSSDLGKCLKNSPTYNREMHPREIRTFFPEVLREARPPRRCRAVRCCPATIRRCSSPTPG